MEPKGDPSIVMRELLVMRGSPAQIRRSEAVFSAVSEFMLGRRHVMTALRVRKQRNGGTTVARPKSMLTQAADGNTCGSCAFFIPLQGELGTMFGVCTNKWSQMTGK